MVLQRSHPIRKRLALRAVGLALFDVIDIHDAAARERLNAYGNGQNTLEGLTAEQIATY